MMREPAVATSLEVFHPLPDIGLHTEDITRPGEVFAPLLDDFQVIGGHVLGLQKDQLEQSVLAGIERQPAILV